MSYTYRLTALAEAFAEAHASRDRVIERATQEITDAMAADPDERFNGVASFMVADRLFVAFSHGDGAVVIDTATFEEGMLFTEGPFKGKRMVYPRADSEDR